MVRWLILILRLAAASLKSRRNLLLENLALRHQLLILSRGSKRPRLMPPDRALWVWLSHYLISRARRPPSQNWKAFLRNHLGSMVSVDFLTVPTLTLRVLYVFIVLSHHRRRLLHFNVVESPSAGWTAQQLREG